MKTQLEQVDKLVATWPLGKDAQIKDAFYSEFQAAVLGASRPRPRWPRPSGR